MKFSDIRVTKLWSHTRLRKDGIHKGCKGEVTFMFIFGKEQAHCLKCGEWTE